MSDRFQEIISVQKIKDNSTGKLYDGLIEDDLLRLLNDISYEKELLYNYIECINRTSTDYVNKGYDLPMGTDLSYWLGIKNCTAKILSYFEKL